MSPAGAGMKLICPIMIELDMVKIPTIITFFDEIRGLDHRSIIGMTPLEPKVLLNHYTSIILFLLPEIMAQFLLIALLMEH